MNPSITLTGIDERTDVSALISLDAEIGILYSATPEGRHRYPGKEFIREASRALPRLAIHICGSPAREYLAEGWLDDLLENAQRIQINGFVSPPECERVCAMYPEKMIITQHFPENTPLYLEPTMNHQVLVDASGGRGITPTFWRKPCTDKQVGYAGGLGVDNMVEQLEKIRAIARGNWWVDMEQKLRVDGWFSIERAKDCVALFHSAITASLESA